jgi:hypothetical protein
VFGPVLVSMRVLMIRVRRIFGVSVFVAVMLSNPARFVVPIAVLVRVGMLMAGVLNIVGMAMLVDGVFRVGLGHRGPHLV